MIQRYSDYNTLSRAGADLILKVLRVKPEGLICIASGDTPKGVCDCLVADVRAGKADFSNCTFVGLDEWVGMDEHDEGSCKHFIYGSLFVPLGLRPEQIVYFDAKAADLEAECAGVNAFIESRGGLDVMLLGVGMNGHLGLNEPGTPFDAYAHVSELDETTKTVGQKYFARKTLLSRGVTLGLRHFQEAGLPILMANGARKAEIIQKALQGPVSTEIPASIVQTLPHALALLDVAAAEKL
jgi:glucosamine-6-phosphate deaminase